MKCFKRGFFLVAILVIFMGLSMVSYGVEEGLFNIEFKVIGEDGKILDMSQEGALIEFEASYLDWDFLDTQIQVTQQGLVFPISKKKDINYRICGNVNTGVFVLDGILKASELGKNKIIYIDLRKLHKVDLKTTFDGKTEGLLNCYLYPVPLKKKVGMDTIAKMFPLDKGKKTVYFGENTYIPIFTYENKGIWGLYYGTQLSSKTNKDYRFFEKSSNLRKHSIDFDVMPLSDDQMLIGDFHIFGQIYFPFKSELKHYTLYLPSMFQSAAFISSKTRFLDFDQIEVGGKLKGANKISDGFFVSDIEWTRYGASISKIITISDVYGNERHLSKGNVGLYLYEVENEVETLVGEFEFGDLILNKMNSKKNYIIKAKPEDSNAIGISVFQVKENFGRFQVKFIKIEKE